MRKLVAMKTKKFDTDKDMIGKGMEISIMANHKYEYEEFGNYEIISNEHKIYFKMINNFIKVSITAAHDLRKRYSFIYQFVGTNNNSLENFIKIFIKNFKTMDACFFPDKI